MGIGMTRVQHVKIPVSDLGCSAGWYATLLDQVPFREFVAHGGALPGAALRSQKPQLSSHSGNGSSPPASPA
jgi:hypothetical protein